MVPSTTGLSFFRFSRRGVLPRKISYLGERDLRGERGAQNLGELVRYLSVRTISRLMPCYSPSFCLFFILFCSGFLSPLFLLFGRLSPDTMVLSKVRREKQTCDKSEFLLWWYNVWLTKTIDWIRCQKKKKKKNFTQKRSLFLPITLRVAL